jgi:hypothetical protein
MVMIDMADTGSLFNLPFRQVPWVFEHHMVRLVLSCCISMCVLACVCEGV